MNNTGFTSSIEEQLVESMNTIVDSSLGNFPADQTVIARVLECLDETTGKYKIRYQDATIEAYAVSPTTYFENGSSVYVLMPQGRFDDRHLILWGERSNSV